MVKKKTWAVLVVALLLATTIFAVFGRSIWYPWVQIVRGKQTVASVIDAVGSSARQALQVEFARANVAYPPQNLTLLALKSTKQLELWATDSAGENRFIRRYPILAASGVLGPKLREGDRQVPEGIYQISGLNPNSSYHLSMKLNYPNPLDLKHAKAEGRNQPGTNIFIHGKSASIGCLAMGDRVIEQLFTLVHDVGKEHVRVIIAPADPRMAKLQVPQNAPVWVNDLYQRISAAVKPLI